MSDDSLPKPAHKGGAVRTISTHETLDFLIVGSGRPARRPTATFAMDAHTRAIVGWHVTS
jgi:transposase InsO family protein